MKNITENYGRDLDLNLLRVFAIVAEERNITRAAGRLYVTQPAVSAAIRRLSAFVGAELFVRQGRGVVPTRRGEELLVATRLHLSPLVAATMATTHFDPLESTATIRIGIVDGLEMAVVPRLLAALRARAPNMQLVVLSVQFRTVEELLLANKVDLALCVADDLPRSIARECVLSGRGVRGGFVCLYDPRFCALPTKLTERVYFEQDHVAVSYAGDTRGVVEDSLARSRTVRVSVPTLGAVADVVDGSALLATVPIPLALHVVKTRPHLRWTRLPFELGGPDLELLWSRAASGDETVRFVRELLTEIVGALVKEARPRRQKLVASFAGTGTSIRESSTTP